jgi:hypothetical protein
MGELNYEEDVKIDQDALDVEWLGQASLGLKYGRNVAHWHHVVARLEEEKKTMRSELIMEANKHPEKCCGKEKPNAADIEAYYRSSENYQGVVSKLLDAQYEAEYAEVAKNEICYSRKSALENLVKLHGQMYFAGPKVPRNLSKEWEEAQRRKLSDQKVTMKRSK